jgi:Fe-S cluster assembly protein SufD
MVIATIPKRPLEQPMTAHIVQRTPAETTLGKQFAAQEGQTPSPRRAAAFARFAKSGLPSRRVEAWHYTDLRASMADAAPISPAPGREAIGLARKLLAERERLGGARLVLLDGRYVADLSDRCPVGVEVASGAAAPAGVDDPLVALNEALSIGGCTITVERGVEISQPIEIVHIKSGDRAESEYSRTAIALGPGSQASFLEVFVGGSPAVQRHTVTMITLAKKAKAKHVAIVGDNAGLHIESQVCELSEKAELKALGFVSGGSLTRRQIFLKMTGEDAKVSLGGLALLDGARRADTTVQIVHSAPRGTSREFYRAIVDDEAVGVFQGRIVVEGAAQKTDGAMKSQAILLSPQAQMNQKPELEIFADDVVCGHGATVSSLDPEQVFYLQSRGIPESEAKAMLLEAFGGEAIDRIEDDLLSGAMRAPFRAWLEMRV